ncbi:MAG: hypothetical protein RL217_638 [Pseudomonadota bacterium]
MLCPCHSTRPYSDCCEPWHSGQNAPSPEALMRSRYCAFVLNKTDYLLKSWHASTRPKSLEDINNTNWLHLEILDSQEQGSAGKVRFNAYFKEDGSYFSLSENSNFIKENGQWFYVDGVHQILKIKPERNDPCPCSSGKKFKKCCG